MLKLKYFGKSVASTVLVAVTMFALGTAPASAKEVYQGYNGQNCVDGTSASDFTATWNQNNSFTVITKNHEPACNDITLYASSYVLTSSDYKGGYFGATGSYPQSLYQTVTLTIAKGTNGGTTPDRGYTWVPTTLTVPLSPCGNQQVDLYIGPEVKTVGAAGHGSQYIAGNIIQKDQSTVQQCQGGQGGGPTTPTTPTIPSTPQVLSDATTPAATLTDTGLNVRLTSILAAALVAGAAYVFTRRTKVSE